MKIAEIEKELYINHMRIGSIEAALKRVGPFSEDFTTMVTESLRLQEKQKQLGIEKIKTLSAEVKSAQDGAATPSQGNETR